MGLKMTFAPVSRLMRRTLLGRRHSTLAHHNNGVNTKLILTHVCKQWDASAQSQPPPVSQ